MSEFSEPSRIKPDAYRASAKMLSETIPPYFGIHLPDNVQKSWRVVMSAIKQVDTVVDQIPSNNQTMKRSKADEFIATIQRNLLQEEEQTEPDEVIKNNNLSALITNIKKYSRNVREQFLEKLTDLKNATLDVPNAQTLTEYIAKRKREGKLTAELLLTLIDDETRRHPNYQHLSNYIIQISELATVIDSALDWEEDFTTGEISFPPHKTNKIQMGYYIARDMLALIPHTHPRLCQQLIFALLKA